MAIFDVILNDQVSGPAESAASSVQGLATDIGGLSREFDALQKSMSSAGGMSGIMAQQQAALAHHDKGAYKAPDESDILSGVAAEQQKNLAAHADAAAAALGREKAILASIAAEQKKNLAMQDQDRDARAGREKADAELASTSKWFTDLRAKSSSWEEALGGARMQLMGIAKEMAPLVAVATVVTGIIVAGMSKAIEVTQATALRMARFAALAGSSGAGKAVLTMTAALAEGSLKAFTTGQINNWAQSLLAAGVQGQELQRSILAVASAQAIMGDSGAGAADTLIKRFAMLAATGGKVALDRRILNQLAEAGVSVQALAAELGIPVAKLNTATLSAQKLGDAMRTALIKQGKGPLSELGLTWDSIEAKLREGYNSLFGGLGDAVKPFMVEVRSLAEEFFKGSTAAKDAKGPITSLFTVAFKVAAQFVNFLHRGGLGIYVAFLQVRVALMPVTGLLTKLGIGSALTSVALYLLKGTAITLAVVFGILGIAVLLCALPFIVLGLGIYAIVSAIEYLVDHLEEGKAYLFSLGVAAAEAGSNFITSLGNAISDGAAWVVGLITSLAASMIGAITGPLKIRSPSRVAMQLGAHFTTGLAMGVEQGTPAVEAAAGGAGAAAVTGASSGAAGAGGSRGGDMNVSITIEVKGGATKDALDDLEERLFLVLERVRLRAGLGGGVTA